MAVNDIVMSAAGASGPATFVEDVFSCFLYTGNDSTQTITNGIDLAGKGGLVWMKQRAGGAFFGGRQHYLLDTVRGNNVKLSTNNDSGNGVGYSSYFTFLSSGFSLGAPIGFNESGSTNASWTFRKQPKFFDVVTYTGNGVARTIAHNLGSAPGFYVVKRTDTTSNWSCYHRSLGNGGLIDLNGTGDASLGNGRWNFTSPTSTVFSVSDDPSVNGSGGTYVAYLFAHDAGGFGATGTDNVISCGSFDVVNGVSTEVNLGYEPQFVLIKRTDGVGDWRITDNMRGFMASTRGPLLSPNTSNAEVAGDSPLYITSTGFKTITTSATLTYIYIAIRRPMKTPTVGTEVFAPVSIASAAGTPVTTGFTVDLILNGTNTTTDSSNYGFYDRLRGIPSISSGNATGSISSSTAAEVAYPIVRNANNLGFQVGSYNGVNQQILHSFRRAAGFFDVVCYTGTGVARTINHNLSVVPEMMIVKSRSSPEVWAIYTATTGNTVRLKFDDTTGNVRSSWNNTTPTSTVFSVGADSNTNNTNQTFVAYLFASCAGVSKVGSYTGNGSSQTINCGFTTGARFFLVKATSTTGNWWVYDSARGIISSNDPALALNSAAAEVTSADAVDADSSGIIVNQEATCSINASGVSYIFLAIA